MNTLAPAFDLLLTGDRHDNRVRLYVRGNSVMVPCALLDALVAMLVARIETESGYTEIPRQTVLRLRKEIDGGGENCGRELIETGFKAEYRFAIPKSEIAARIGVTACFFEFVDLAIISPNQADAIRRTCTLCDLPVTEK